MLLRSSFAGILFGTWIVKPSACFCDPVSDATWRAMASCLVLDLRLLLVFLWPTPVEACSML